MTTTTDHFLNAHPQRGAMDNTIDPEPEVPERARGPRRYSAKYKAQILEEYEASIRPQRARCCDAKACTRR